MNSIDKTEIDQKHQAQLELWRIKQRQVAEKKYKDAIEGYDYVVCQECGHKGADLSTHVINLHKMTTDEYKAKHNVTTMKCQKMRDKMKGTNNPAYQHGGKFSPFSEKFFKGTEHIDAIKEKAKRNRQLNDSDSTKISYWLKKTNGDLEKAQELLSKRQSTFSLESCIAKHGEEKGKQVWLDRQERWHKSFKKSNFSKISQKLFWGIAKGLDNLENIYFAQLDENKKEDLSGANHELRMKLDKVLLPDFIDTQKKKIIEFDGDYWHGEKRGNQTRDSDKQKIFESNGYEVFRVLERDYKNNPETVIDQCLEFLRG